MKKLRTLTLALLCLAAAGCPTWERASYQTLAVTQTTLNTLQSDYEAGCPTPVTTACIPHDQAAFNAITKAKQADVLAVNALELYEQEKATGASPSTLAGQQTIVTTALAALPQLIADAKALYESPSGGK